MATTGGSVKLFLPSLFKFPVTFNTFTKCVHLEPVVVQMLQDFAEEDDAAYQHIKNMKNLQELLARDYYHLVFMCPAIRQKYPFQLKACPNRLKSLLLTKPASILLATATTQLRYLCPTLCPFPVSLEEFSQRADNLYKVLQHILKDVAAADNCKAYYRLRMDVEFLEQMKKDYYHLFYMQPAIREQYKLRLKACPASIQQRILASVANGSADANTPADEQKRPAPAAQMIVEAAAATEQPQRTETTAKLRKSWRPNMDDLPVDFTTFAKYTNLQESVTNSLKINRPEKANSCKFRDSTMTRWYCAWYALPQCRKDAPIEISESCPEDVRLKILAVPEVYKHLVKRKTTKQKRSMRTEPSPKRAKHLEEATPQNYSSPVTSSNSSKETKSPEATVQPPADRAEILSVEILSPKQPLLVSIPNTQSKARTPDEANLDEIRECGASLESEDRSRRLTVQDDSERSSVRQKDVEQAARLAVTSSTPNSNKIVGQHITQALQAIVQTTTNQVLQMADNLCVDVPLQCPLSSVMCCSSWPKRFIWRCVTKMPCHIFLEYACYYHKDNNNGSRAVMHMLLVHCFQRVIIDGMTWPVDLFIPLERLKLYMLQFSDSENCMENISPKLLHWSDLCTTTDYDDCVRLDYMKETGNSELTDELLQSRRMHYYEKCWREDNWLWRVPTAKTTSTSEQRYSSDSDTVTIPRRAAETAQQMSDTLPLGQQRIEESSEPEGIVGDQAGRPDTPVVIRADVQQPTQATYIPPSPNIFSSSGSSHGTITQPTVATVTPIGATQVSDTPRPERHDDEASSDSESDLFISTHSMKSKANVVTVKQEPGGSMLNQLLFIISDDEDGADDGIGYKCVPLSEELIVVPSDSISYEIEGNLSDSVAMVSDGSITPLTSEDYVDINEGQRLSGTLNEGDGPAPMPTSSTASMTSANSSTEVASLTMTVSQALAADYSILNCSIVNGLLNQPAVEPSSAAALPISTLSSTKAIAPDNGSVNIECARVAAPPVISKCILYRALYKFHYFECLSLRNVTEYHLSLTGLHQRYIAVRLRSNGLSFPARCDSITPLLSQVDSLQLCNDVQAILSDLKEFHYTRFPKESTAATDDLRARVLSQFFHTLPPFGLCHLRATANAQTVDCEPASAYRPPCRPLRVPFTSLVKPSILARMKAYANKNR